MTQAKDGYWNGMILCWRCFEGKDCENCVGLTCQCPHT